jgi:NADH dehydrogenase FAD-containing subunit
MGLKKKRSVGGPKHGSRLEMKKTKVIILAGGFGGFSGFVAWFLWRSVYLLKLPRLAKKMRVALSWSLEILFSKDLEQMLTLRDVELISRIGTSLRSDSAN